MGGIIGLAAGLGRPIWTEDYRTDERIPHERGDESTAARLGLRGMAAVPLRASEGTIIGTLAVSYREPHVFEDDELAVLKTLADHAAIAITNTSLLERLSESEERYRHLVQNSPDLVWSIDTDANFTFVSDTCERLTGWRPDELLGRHFGALVHESSREVAEVDWTVGLTAPNQELRGRLNLLHKDGHPIPAEFSAMSELDPDGGFLGANGSVRDMTDRDRLERELRESEERYRFLVQNSPDVVFQIDDQGRFSYLGETIERMTGFSPDEIVGQHFSTIVDPDSHAEAGARWAALAADPSSPQTVQIKLRHKSGSTVPVEVIAVGMIGENGRFDGIHGATRDVTERESLARNLREQAAALAAGEERAHLARELHDSVTQALFSMTLLTRTTEILLDRDPEKARDKLGTLRDLQREALAEMRALIFELRPGNLEQDGLDRALKTHTAALSGRIGLPIVVSTNLDDRLPIEIEDVIYRIAQEALHNIVKHAGARQVHVELEGRPDTVSLRIVDDGQGFDPTNIPEGHLGLAGMRARAAKIGGRLTIRSRPGSGTTVELQVPLRPAVDPERDKRRNGSFEGRGSRPETAGSTGGAADREEVSQASAE
jgi:PAS domain S-box-containing protein